MGIALTSDAWARWWLLDEVDENGLNMGPTNQVSVLQPNEEGELEQIGFIGPIAEGKRYGALDLPEIEDIGNLENIDPLWVIDLSDLLTPLFWGRFRVSTYIHPVNENTLLTIGIGR